MICPIKKTIKFARVGGLSSVVQKGYSAEADGFHKPPARKGIYAFVHPHISPFLLGGSFSNINTKHSKFEYVKDKKGNLVEYVSGDYEKYTWNWAKCYSTVKKDDKEYLVKPKKLKIFEHTGELWHHLGHHLKPSQIKKSKDNWTLSDYSDYYEAFQKERHSCFKQAMNIFGEEMNKMESKNPFRFFVVDHLEVFIEKVY